MANSKGADHVTRNTILKLLSDEEVAQVSTAETTSELTEGQEYLDLEHLDQGVQCANSATRIAMPNVLPRSAISSETWSKILAELARKGRAVQTPSLPRLHGAGRLFRDRGFVIHLAAYLIVNALLIVVNVATTTGKYWFYWPLLGWGIGIAGHAFGVLGHPKGHADYQARRARIFATRSLRPGNSPSKL